MKPVTPGGKGDRGPGWRALRPRRPTRRKWKSTFQTFRKEVCLTDRVMCPVPSTILQEAVCCECQTKFGGRLPVPRAEAVLPYWVPLSLRPRKQIQKMVRFCIPKTTKSCLCLCHHFGGRLPVPRDQAAMPYWVPQALRSPKKKPSWTCASGTTAGGSAATGTSSSSGSTCRPFTRMSRWPWGGEEAPQPLCCLSCPSASAS
ncbi:uncharacterized protein C16orf95 homolog isoform X2 [Equus asinus]|uniref:uncharacterized protein C16orf95 homolog isoform X2 n=1 Tax=Equus asinus TaxID=9793 RepID=UPI0038F73D28